jgi:hypothetical protein
MNAPEHQIQNLVERLARIERQNRRMKRGLVMLALVCGSILFVGYTSLEEQLQGVKNLHVTQLDVNQIAVRDASGQLRAWFGIADNETKILFYDENGRQRAGLGLTSKYEPALGIFDGNNNTRIVLGMVEGWPGLVMRDPQGQKRVALHSREDWATLTFFDRREKKRASIGAAKEAASVELLDEWAVDRAGLTTDDKGSSLVFFDRAGKKRAGFGIGKEDDPAIGFFSDDGRSELSMTSFKSQPDLSMFGTNQIQTVMRIATNGPLLQILGAEGRTMWRTP